MNQRSDFRVVQRCQRFFLLRVQRREIGRHNILDNLLLISSAGDHAADCFVIENPTQSEIRHCHPLGNQSANLFDRIERYVEVDT